ncbi:MAG: hypothetical protein ACI8P3_001857 [Saprospiraceae bacterium]|jgi:hypothetical protein
MLRKFFFVFFFASTLYSLSAQQELSLHFLRDTWQSSKTNPAFMTDFKVHYGLPNLYFNITHTGPSYNELVVTSTNGENVLDVSAILNTLSENNQLFTSFEVETTSVSFGIKNMRFSFNHALKFNAFLDYPKDLVELAWNGNSQFIGETIKFGPDFQAFAYNEFGLGAAMKFLNVSAGLRLKILTGIGDVSTERTAASLYTDPDIYQLTFDTDYRLNSSSFLAYDGDGEFSLDFGEFSFDRITSPNIGFAVDLGASIQLKKLEISASIIDLGGIKWNENISNYTSQGSYTYDGLDISDIINDDDVSFEETLDTLTDIFDFQESSESYSTMLPTKIYLSGTYKVNDLFKVGGLFYSEVYRGTVFPAFAASASVNLGKVFSVGAVYAIRNKTYDNVGLNATLKLGPVQIFAVTDNIVAAFQPYDSRNVNARIGLNMVFNKKK